tara:strand:+ start:349 stop:699 length:351 start_codon:yes stop_codon:yes gene_type:complete
MKLYKLYYEYRHEVDEPAVFACICEAAQVEKIEKHYSELYGLLIDPCRDDASGDRIPVEALTSDPVLQGWESFDGAILEDLETGERFYYEETGSRTWVTKYTYVRDYKLNKITEEQ